jgi:hypothetical protein
MTAFEAPSLGVQQLCPRMTDKSRRSNANWIGVVLFSARAHKKTTNRVLTEANECQKKDTEQYHFLASMEKASRVLTEANKC